MTYRNEATDLLFRAIGLLESDEERAAFLEDLCTIREIQDMAQRLQTAILLSEGRNYQTISSRAGVSTATISRVSRALNYGSGGYGMVIGKLVSQGEGDEN